MGRRGGGEDRRDTLRDYNADLGVAVLKTLAKVRVDERVVKVLASVDVQGELA